VRCPQGGIHDWIENEERTAQAQKKKAQAATIVFFTGVIALVGGGCRIFLG
jgi:hypothetical protein